MEEHVLEALKDESTFKKALTGVAEQINSERRHELIGLFRANSEVQKWLEDVRKERTYHKGSDSKVWRKVASMPIVVDRFFTRMYGPDYYKDPHFFTREHPEWSVLDPSAGRL